MLLGATPEALATPSCAAACPHAYFLKFANDTASVVFGVHACAQWNACDANATAAVDVRASNASGLFPAGAPRALVLPFGSVVALDGASGAVLFNTSDVAPVDAPAIAAFCPRAGDDRAERMRLVRKGKDDWGRMR